MEKPIKPVYPEAKDYRIPTEYFSGEKSPFVKAVFRYHKDLIKYNAEMELYEQTKFIKDIQRSTLKLCLKKYKVTKK